MFTTAGIEVIRTGVRAPRQNSIMERWFRTLRAELTDRTLVWNLPHLMRLLREYEQHYNDHRPHRALGHAAPTRPLPDNVIDFDDFRVRRRDLAGNRSHRTRHNQHQPRPRRMIKSGHAAWHLCVGSDDLWDPGLGSTALC